MCVAYVVACVVTDARLCLGGCVRVCACVLACFFKIMLKILFMIMFMMFVMMLMRATVHRNLMCTKVVKCWSVCLCNVSVCVGRVFVQGCGGGMCFVL